MLGRAPLGALPLGAVESGGAPTLISKDKHAHSLAGRIGLEGQLNQFTMMPVALGIQPTNFYKLLLAGIT